MCVFTTLLLSLILQHAATSPISSAEGTEDGSGYEEALDIVEINKDLNLHEGDIRLMTGRDRNIVVGNQFRWELPVPYVLHESLDLNAKGVVLRAFDQIRLKTCIDFKPWEDEPHYIVVIQDDGCWSYVGNQHQGNQSVSIGQWCDHLAIVEHEFLHALGFWHEQSRYDRDEYVTVVWENIEKGREHNFLKHSSNYTTTLGTMYDYTSVMHYNKDAFSNGNGSTIITNLPEYQDVIGQRLEMSSNDVLKLQKLYNCTSAVTFRMSCSFEDERVCDMTLCAAGNTSWERVGSTKAGPFSDHTSLSSQGENQTESAHGNGTANQNGGGSFMHCSTVSGKEGDGAKMQSRKMNPKRQIQCLQFFYFHSGSDKDQLNIWIREYDREDEETTYLMGQITGPPTSHWQLHHVSLNATRPFQVEFEVRKGAGNSLGGFSVDDINLFETECPHHVWHIPNIDHFLINSSVGTSLLSPRFITRQSYGLQLLLHLYSDHFGVFFRLVSTDHDDQLQWPCVWRQVTVSLLDQSHHIQQRMSKQISITTDSERTFIGDSGEIFHYWDNPRKLGHLINDTNRESYYAGPNLGYRTFLSLDAFRSGNFIKGGSIFFFLSFDDLSTLRLSGSDPPKPQIWSNMNHVTLMKTDDKGTCLNQMMGSTTTIVTPSFISSFAVSLPTGTIFTMLTATVALISGNLPLTL
ncbi:meprin A subunit beta-like [Seriola lalandi dorsalis]|uniref:meprin A subunit beta-like n=1 Tax=Seriola lalandi dorsalis TaxID=1841481 RepID=UPI000C6FC4D8|nr:meprin A subunit beta-like [Seriola lalandi dorsalis]XP_023256853.1 meprin A subunit beta-like [Seriola lalandi dorsalis]